MADATLIVAPNYLAKLTGVAVIKITARKYYACNEKLETLFKCSRKSTDGVELQASFINLAALIAERHLLESLPKEKTFAQKV